MTTKNAANSSESKKTAPKKPKSSAPKPEEAVKSSAFQEAKSKAEEYARDPEKAKNLIDQAMKKAKGKNNVRGKIKGPLDEVWMYLTALTRLTRAYVTHQYTDVPWKSIVLAIAALIYFVSPIDLIPDIIPLIGLTDDAAIIYFVVTQIKADLDDFLAWENSQSDEEITDSSDA